MILSQNTIPPKDPLAVLPYQFDWTAWLSTNETISSAVITVPSGITLSQAASVNGGLVTFWLSGGTTGGAYLIACEIVTSQGRTDSRSFSLLVQTR